MESEATTAGAPGPSDDASAAKPTPPAFYTVDHYDEARDPAADLAMTVERAQREGKHILIQVGGNWCPWCHLMSKFVESTPAVRERIEANYLWMKVADGSKKPNEAFLADYPEIPGHPHLYVLDSDGQLLHSQATAELELKDSDEDGYDEEVYLAFLAKWRPDAN